MSKIIVILSNPDGCLKPMQLYGDEMEIGYSNNHHLYLRNFVLADKRAVCKPNGCDSGGGWLSLSYHQAVSESDLNVDFFFFF